MTSRPPLAASNVIGGVSLVRRGKEHVLGHDVILLAGKEKVQLLVAFVKESQVLGVQFGGILALDILVVAGKALDDGFCRRAALC